VSQSRERREALSALRLEAYRRAHQIHREAKKFIILMNLCVKTSRGQNTIQCVPATKELAYCIVG
jgi:hypothetical protein